MTRFTCPRLLTPALALAAALSLTAGCDKRQANGIASPDQAQAALQDAFKQANPEFKTAAEEAASAIQNDPAKALVQLQALSASPDLDQQQRNAAQESILLLTTRLRAAAAQGDAEAEKALQFYRASR